MFCLKLGAFLFFLVIPYKQLPALEYNGKILIQSNAIARFLAREYNLAGKTNLEQCEADGYLECVDDLIKSK